MTAYRLHAPLVPRVSRLPPGDDADRGDRHGGCPSGTSEDDTPRVRLEYLRRAADSGESITLVNTRARAESPASRAFRPPAANPGYCVPDIRRDGG